MMPTITDGPVIAAGDSGALLGRLKARSPEALTSESLTLEEIFVTTLRADGAIA